MPERTRRFELRLTAEHKKLLEQAATIQGQTVTAFARGHLLEDAQVVLERYRTTVLSLRDWDRLMHLIENPPKPNARCEPVGYSITLGPAASDRM